MAQREYTVALIGNPNVGKSTLFNRLTGLRQHTGNWPGKTVEQARGRCVTRGRVLQLVDLPGTYSLISRSREETVTAAWLRDSAPDCVLVLCDATCLERSLILALQLQAVTRRLVVGVNLMDEARRRGIDVDLSRLQRLLGIPVLGLSAGSGEGVEALLRQVCSTCEGFAAAVPAPVRPSRQTAALAQSIAGQTVRGGGRPGWERRLDRFLTRPVTGALAMSLLLVLCLWVTVSVAAVPSALLERGFARLGEGLTAALAPLGPFWQGLLAEGLYGTLSRVVAVMLPPMAIFFPLFTLLEDAGLLPRLAFLLDGPLSRCGGEGRMALTMCMGLGCNAAGVTGCRIIADPAERELAMVTNALVPCNGRLPALILLSGLVAPGCAPLVLAGCLGLSVLVTALSGLVWRKGHPAAGERAFLLELPPYRRPRIGQVLVRSLLDRTLFVLGRAVRIAAPAGVIIWLLDRFGLLPVLASALDPAAGLLGLSGGVLLAFFLALPAGELVLPVAALILPQPLFATWQSALCALVFFLFHWPCGTTIATVWAESRRVGTVAAAILLPTAAGCGLCALLRLLLA